MPAERLLPLCPRVIATSKPGKGAWAREELEDALAGLPHYEVRPAGYPGVLVAYTREPPGRVAEEILSWEYAYISSIIIAGECTRPDEVVGVVRVEIERCPRRSIDLRLKLRGPCRGLKAEIESLLRGRVRRSRRSPYGLVVECLQDLAVAGCGRAVTRPYGVRVYMLYSPVSGAPPRPSRTRSP
ncbi:MAG: hypothetical protein F7C35_00150 [Desulfurococcales archaeon]|nr:hypothetical protein [Desulfurococcales archaeon]